MTSAGMNNNKKLGPSQIGKTADTDQNHYSGYHIIFGLGHRKYQI